MVKMRNSLLPADSPRPPTKPRTKPRQGTQTATPASACYIQGVTPRTRASRAAPPRQSLQRTMATQREPVTQESYSVTMRTKLLDAAPPPHSPHATTHAAAASHSFAMPAAAPWRGCRRDARHARDQRRATKRARWQRRAAAHLKLRQKWTFEILKEVARLRCL